MAEAVKIEIGPGRNPRAGYTSVDIKDGNKGWPLDAADDSVDEIYASHVLEHFSFCDTRAVLIDWHRALKPGGVLKVAVPDFDKIDRFYKKREHKELIQPWIMGGHTDEHDYHKAIFNSGGLNQSMRVAGFINVVEFAPEHPDCSTSPCSLNLMGVKPGPDVAEVQPKPPPGKMRPPAPVEVRVKTTCTKPVRAVGIWSTPRLGFMDNFESIYSSLAKVDIPLLRGEGVFWGQKLEMVALDAIKNRGAEVLLTLDYDSVFTLHDIMRLFELLEEHPEASAIAAHQYNRAAETPLYTVDGREPHGPTPLTGDEIRAAGDLFPVDTAHFGLTLLRVSHLQEMPHPWFKAIPDDNGTWGDGKTDSDMYFWRHLACNGGQAYLAPKVPIGHLELDVRWPDENLELMHQHIYDYRRDGKPSGVFGSGAETETDNGTESSDI